jgi:hypothetical protein
MSNRVTSKHVHEQLDWLKQELIEAGMFSVDDTFGVQEGSATYGRAWRIWLDGHINLPHAFVNQLGGGSGYLGDTAREAVETVKGARRILRAIVETRKETQREIVDQLASLGIPVASLARGFMDGGLTFAESIAASVALVN